MTRAPFGVTKEPFLGKISRYTQRHALRTEDAPGLQNEATLRVLDMTSEALITFFLGFGGAALSLAVWKLSRAQSTNRL